MRLIAVVAVLALITLATAFDYEASGLPFTGDDEAAPTLGLGGHTSSASPAALDQASIGEFTAPVGIISRPSDERVIVIELFGTITAASSDDRVVLLDVSAITQVEGEQGLLGAAFHPTEPLLYVHYSNLDGDSVVAEYEIDDETGIADPASARQVLFVEQPYPNHNGGQLAFGPDGYLYAGFGDGGLADDPVRSALDLSSRLGKILRIDPTASATDGFTVPADNPFVNEPDADPTIWSYGLRNPWKFSFDPATGGLWIADVGQNRWEEINFAPAVDGAAGRGLSFGWSAFEGNARFNQDQPSDGHTEPFVSYARDEGRCSISGGEVYRGTANPALMGWYVYGDYCTGQIFGFDVSLADNEREILELGQVDALVAIAAGPDGELYAASVAGPVYRLG